MRRRRERAASIVLVLLVQGFAACVPAEPPAPRVQLFEKEGYQALYARDGRLLRVVLDRNGDGLAEVVTLFDRQGQPSAVEIDGDGDGAVDRWEHHAPDGTLEKVGVSRRSRSRPDFWEYPGPDGEIVRRDFDDDGDDVVDRSEFLEGGRVVREQTDSDRDGRPDRRLLRDAAGALVTIEQDLDGDGLWEKAIAVKRRGED